MGTLSKAEHNSFLGLGVVRGDKMEREAVTSETEPASRTGV